MTRSLLMLGLIPLVPFMILTTMAAPAGGQGGNTRGANDERARALMKHTELSAREIAEESLKIAGEICIYTNSDIIVEEI